VLRRRHQRSLPRLSVHWLSSAWRRTRIGATHECGENVSRISAGWAWHGRLVCTSLCDVLARPGSISRRARSFLVGCRDKRPESLRMWEDLSCFPKFGGFVDVQIIHVPCGGLFFVWLEASTADNRCINDSTTPTMPRYISDSWTSIIFGSIDYSL
jgi:hypothetical protein